MIEDYGTLSEEELIEEIKKELEENQSIDASDLEFKFEKDKLLINGTLQNEDELEVLVNLLEDYIDPKDYQCDIELIETIDDTYSNRSGFESSDEDEKEEEEEDELLEEGLEEVEEEDLDYDDEDEEGFDDEKW